MKCFVLAGGSGDALWPLSRKNYPKQFIYIREGRSLFQEAIARNLPFCDEFYIITNSKYRYIVEGQLQAFQGLKYSCFFEEVGRQTAPAVTILSMCVERNEDVLVVSTDHLIGEGDYNGTIIRAKALLGSDNIVVVGCRPEQTETDAQPQSAKGHSVFVYEGHEVVKFANGCDVDRKDNFLLDSGIFLMKAGTYLNAIKENECGLYDMCVKGNNRIRLEGKNFLITKQWLSGIPSLSVGEGVFRKWAGKHIDIVEGSFRWSRLLSQEVLTEFNLPSLRGPAIMERCENVAVLNQDRQKLVAVNACHDLVIVNTKDAVYVSQKGNSAGIREIINEHYEEQKDIFDEGDIFYTTWGMKETLNRSEGYTVKKMTIFPGKSVGMHKHEQRSEHWSVVSGTAFITINGRTGEYGRNSSVFVPIGTYHKIENKTAKDLIMIEVSVGVSAGAKNGDILPAMDEFIKLRPVYKNYIWGGEKLRERFGKGKCLSADTKIAESWEISAHKAGICTIADGSMKGMLFTEYLERIGKSAWGWKCQPFDKFPILIKFIDATHPLSVQVHPDDAYAMSVEGDYGKNEMWYVLDADPGASLYLGFCREVSKEECRKRIEEGTLTEVLNRIHVSKGDVIFVKAGTVHAILEGLLILEIQQSSNATYRLYDYDRVDADGRKRPLHLKKAFDNMDFGVYQYEPAPVGKKETGTGYIRRVLGECKYFSSILYEVKKAAELSLDDASFSAIVFLAGNGEIGMGGQKACFAAGDSFFIPAQKKVLSIWGECRFVLSRI